MIFAINTGPGASVRVWQRIFGPNDEMWEAEFDAKCVKKAEEGGLMEGFHTLTGDQGNSVVLKNWIEQSGGDFDIVVDDGAR